jgi:DNA-3-methyladenine glycosylase
MSILKRDFYLRQNVVQIARDLLGKSLCTLVDGEKTSGIICETEAYAGITDRASHAYGGRRTARTEIMYRVGGTAYVYLCYGVHSLFNVVTNDEGVPDAVLIRGIIPEDGIEAMLRRAGKIRLPRDFGSGPGNVAKLLGIHYAQSGADLVRNEGTNCRPAIWIEDRGTRVDPAQIITSTRIGIDYAGDDALLPYRFTWRKM